MNHIYGSDDYVDEGSFFENEAMAYFRNKGYDIVKATTEQNMSGIDYFINDVPVDHKSRGDLIFIEIHLASKNKFNNSYYNGWLFGPSKLIIFSNRNTGLSYIVEKEKLKQWFMDNKSKLVNMGRPQYDEHLVAIDWDELVNLDLVLYKFWLKPYIK